MILMIFLVLSGGCAKRVVINYDQLKPNSLVKIKTISGKSGEGIIKSKKPSFLIMRFDKNSKKLTKINRDAISCITGHKTYVHDDQNKIISEWEIDGKKGNNNLLLYSIGGGGVSFGASFFLGSLLNRRFEDVDQGRTAMWTTAAVGTILGTTLFAKSGAKHDRNIAIDKIREQRIELAKKQAEQERLKRKKLHEELKKMKAERKKQDEEIMLLKKKAEKK